MNKKNKLLLLLGTIFFVILLIIFNKSQKKENEFFISKDINRYELYTDRGDSFKTKIVLNKPSIFFFGFLNCPDICPNTLHEISNIIDKLGNKSKKINFFFVTVDPERDTISNMREYLDNFNENIIGITGEKESMKNFLKSMHVYYEKVFISKDFYTLDHSSQMYIFKKSGKFFGTISLNEKENIVLEKIKSVI